MNKSRAIGRHIGSAISGGSTGQRIRIHSERNKRAIADDGKKISVDAHRMELGGLSVG